MSQERKMVLQSDGELEEALQGEMITESLPNEKAKRERVKIKLSRPVAVARCINQQGYVISNVYDSWMDDISLGIVKQFKKESPAGFFGRSKKIETTNRHIGSLQYKVNHSGDHFDTDSWKLSVYGNEYVAELEDLSYQLIQID